MLWMEKKKVEFVNFTCQRAVSENNKVFKIIGTDWKKLWAMSFAPEFIFKDRIVYINLVGVDQSARKQLLSNQN